ncbi:MAG: thioredoxin [Chloroflexi bacterium]|nr:thioredoxin [Chloroflexota bacterium]
MSKPIPVNDTDFDQKVLKADKPVLVDLWATWCKPCLMVAPIIDELAEEFSGRINFVKVDVDQNPKTASRYGVMSIPTLLIFKNGEPVSHIVGARPKSELKKNLNAVLG